VKFRCQSLRRFFLPEDALAAQRVLLSTESIAVPHNQGVKFIQMCGQFSLCMVKSELRLYGKAHSIVLSRYIKLQAFDQSKRISIDDKKWQTKGIAEDGIGRFFSNSLKRKKISAQFLWRGRGTKRCN
jgi:hypothetical protein